MNISKNQPFRFASISVACAVAVALSACGGGSDDDVTVVQPTPEPPIVVDPPVTPDPIPSFPPLADNLKPNILFAGHYLVERATARPTPNKKGAIHVVADPSIVNATLQISATATDTYTTPTHQISELSYDTPLAANTVVHIPLERTTGNPAFQYIIPAALMRSGTHWRLFVNAPYHTAQGPQIVRHAAIDVSPQFSSALSFSTTLVPIVLGTSGPNNLPSVQNLLDSVIDKFPMATARAQIDSPITLSTTLTNGRIANQDQILNILVDFTEGIDARYPQRSFDQQFFGMFDDALLDVNISGIAYSPGFSGIGWDRTGKQWSGTMTHEMGHSFSLMHAPCGSPTQLDTAYPNADGTLGATPFDFSIPGLNLIERYDVMSYCDGNHFSPYNINKMQAFMSTMKNASSNVAKQVQHTNAEQHAHTQKRATNTGSYPFSMSDSDQIVFPKDMQNLNQGAAHSAQNAGARMKVQGAPYGSIWKLSGSPQSPQLDLLRSNAKAVTGKKVTILSSTGEKVDAIMMYVGHLDQTLIWVPNGHTVVQILE